MPARLKDTRGFTGIEIILAVIAAILLSSLIFGGYSAYKIAAAKSCETKLIAMSRSEQQWEASKVNGNPDTALCNQINGFVTAYNSSCAQFGTIAALKCG